MKYIDTFLNKITMYRLVLYYLTGLDIVAMILGFFKIIPYGPIDIFVSTLFIICICWIANTILAKTFKVATNTESVYITAFILALIITPAQSAYDMNFLALAFWTSVLAMASKFIFNHWRKHIFNPAAIAVVITAFGLNLSASWWVGTWSLLPFVVVGGLLMTRKICRFDLVGSFFIVAIFAVFGAHPNIAGFQSIFSKLFLETPLFFFAFIMLTEPLTTPPTRILRILYGSLVGLLFAPWVHIGSVYSTPELALIVGNIFSYIVSPKGRFVLRLREKKQIAVNTYNFWFDFVSMGSSLRRPAFKPGQYMEWTLPVLTPDSRGNRRYFTIASAPSEKGIALGVKMYEPSSSFKKSLMAMNQGDSITAGQLSGDFTLPRKRKRAEKDTKIVFIAGGIGITPFRSMVQELLNMNEVRPITLFYSNNTPADVSYREIFDKAEKKIGLKTIYVMTRDDGTGMYPSKITAEMIRTEVSDFAERTFYLSGPRGMVVSYEKILLDMGINRFHIKKDFFPGFA